MEKQSLHSPSLRRRNNRPGGGNRNRNRNRNRGGQNRNSGQRSGGGNRNRNSNRNRSRQRPAPRQTTGQKILSFLTFGLLGKPKPKGRKPRPQKKQEPAQTQRQQARAKEAAAGKPASKKRRNRTEVTSGRLYVGNLSYDTTEQELEELFRGVGNVTSAEVVTNSRTQQSKGFAFVEMGSIGEAKRAVEILDDQDFMGRKLIISGARSEGPRESDGEPTSEPADGGNPSEDNPSDDSSKASEPEASGSPEPSEDSEPVAEDADSGSESDSETEIAAEDTAAEADNSDTDTPSEPVAETQES